MLYDALTARENVEFAAKLYRCGQPRASAEKALAAMQILDRAETPVRALSRGMRQRVSIARAIVHEPAVVLADEPFTGLDIVGARALAGILTEMCSRGAALVLVTHNIEEGLAIATHAAIMNKGKLERIGPSSGIDGVEFAREYHDLVASHG